MWLVYSGGRMKKILLSLFLLVMMIVPNVAKSETVYCWDPQRNITYFQYWEINILEINRCKTTINAYEITANIFNKIDDIGKSRAKFDHVAQQMAIDVINNSRQEIEEHNRNRAQLAKQEQDNKKKLEAELKRKKNLERVAILEKDFGKFCKKHSKGSEQYNNCILEQEEIVKEQNLKKAKNLEAKAKEEQIKVSNMKPEDRNAYTCSEKFGFRKGSDKFKDCIFELYKAETELEKLELQKQVAKANAEAARASAEAARASADRQERLALAQTEAAKMQALAARQQAIAANTADSLALINQGLSMMSPQRPAPRMQTTCTYVGRFLNCF